MAEENPAGQRQTAVTAYLKSKQLLLFVFARRSVLDGRRESCSTKTNSGAADPPKRRYLMSNVP